MDNARRLANVAVGKGNNVSVFMLGKAAMYQTASDDQFNVVQQIDQFGGDFYV